MHLRPPIFFGKGQILIQYQAAQAYSNVPLAVPGRFRNFPAALRRLVHSSSFRNTPHLRELAGRPIWVQVHLRRSSRSGVLMRTDEIRWRMNCAGRCSRLRAPPTHGAPFSLWPAARRYSLIVLTWASFFNPRICQPLVIDFFFFFPFLLAVYPAREAVTEKVCFSL